MSSIRDRSSSAPYFVGCWVAVPPNCVDVLVEVVFGKLSIVILIDLLEEDGHLVATEWRHPQRLHGLNKERLELRGWKLSFMTVLRKDFVKEFRVHDIVFESDADMPICRYANKSSNFKLI